jgi:uncharacterized membrane protein YdjX (TVP38/TMEM64 family)
LGVELPLRRTTALLLTTSSIALIALLYFGHAGFRTELHHMLRMMSSADIAWLRDYLQSFGVWAPIISVALQFLTSILAPLPSFVVTFANAMVFGFWWGVILTWTSWLAAAALCFGLARALGRPVVERLATRKALEATDRYVQNAGFRTLLVARLIPFVNPDVICYAAGLTNVGWKPFMISMAIGSLPSTLVYSYLGARGVTAVGWLMIPLVVLGLLTMAGAFFRRVPQPKVPN